MSLMERYKVNNLIVDPAEFQAHLESLPGTVHGHDPKQREFENVFTWGHDHDFGAFQMKGHMGDRHVRLIDSFQSLGIEFAGRVLDVGCWTGGTSLLLAALGCQVTAVEEVGHYARAAQYLADSFKLDNLTVYACSLYELYQEVYYVGCFNLALCAGVLYHLSDPLRALRILFKALRDGGKLLIDTEVADDGRPMLTYAGPRQPGWRWLIPSPTALRYMLEDVGFRIEHLEVRGNRAMSVAVRDKYVTMTRAGVAL